MVLRRELSNYRPGQGEGVSGKEIKSLDDLITVCAELEIGKTIQFYPGPNFEALGGIRNLIFSINKHLMEQGLDITISGRQEAGVVFLTRFVQENK